jgi:hypothetical protein
MFKSNYFPSLSRRLRDQFIPHWHTTINNLPKLSYYTKFKTIFEPEEYLNKIKSDTLVKLFASFRLSSHNLAIETGRYRSIDRQNRLCEHCTMHVVESEYHFLLMCTHYSEIRMKYFPNTAWLSLPKLYSLMSSRKQSILLNVSKFLNEAFLKRNEINM